MSSMATYFRTSVFPSRCPPRPRRCAPRTGTPGSRGRERRPLQPGLDTVREVVRAPRRERGLRDRLGDVGCPPQTERSRPSTRARSQGNLELVRRDLPGLLADPGGGLRDRGRADGRPAAPVGVPAVRGDVGVTEENLHVLHLEPKLVGGDLREHGLASLPVRRRAGDRDDLPRGMAPDGCGLPPSARVLESPGRSPWTVPSRSSRGRWRTRSDPPHVVGVAPRLLLLAELLVVEQLERGVERGAIVAGVGRQPADPTAWPR